MAKGFYTSSCAFYVMPGDTFLLEQDLVHVPQQGWLFDYYDVDTDITTAYTVDDIRLQVDELAAVTGSPGPPVINALPKRHVHGYRVEISLAP